jgi:hypothetical protein
MAADHRDFHYSHRCGNDNSPPGITRRTGSMPDIFIYHNQHREFLGRHKNMEAGTQTIQRSQQLERKSQITLKNKPVIAYWRADIGCIIGHRQSFMRFPRETTYGKIRADKPGYNNKGVYDDNT